MANEGNGIFQYGADIMKLMGSIAGLPGTPAAPVRKNYRRTNGPLWKDQWAQNPQLQKQYPTAQAYIDAQKKAYDAKDATAQSQLPPGAQVGPDGTVYAPTWNHAGEYVWAPVTNVYNMGAGGPGGAGGGVTGGGGTGTDGTRTTMGGGGIGGVGGGAGMPSGVDLPGLSFIPGIVGAGLGVLGAMGPEAQFKRMDVMSNWDKKGQGMFGGIWKDSQADPYTGDYYRNAKRDMITGTNAMIGQDAQKREEQRLAGGQMFAGGNQRALASMAPAFYEQTGSLLSEAYKIRDRAAQFRDQFNTYNTDKDYTSWEADYDHGRLPEQNRGLNLVNKGIAGGLGGFSQGMNISSQLFGIGMMQAMLGGGNRAVAATGGETGATPFDPTQVPSATAYPNIPVGANNAMADPRTIGDFGLGAPGYRGPYAPDQSALGPYAGPGQTINNGSSDIPGVQDLPADVWGSIMKYPKVDITTGAMTGVTGRPLSPGGSKYAPLPYAPGQIPGQFGPQPDKMLRDLQDRTWEALHNIPRQSQRYGNVDPSGFDPNNPATWPKMPNYNPKTDPYRDPSTWPKPTPFDPRTYRPSFQY